MVVKDPDSGPIPARSQDAFMANLQLRYEHDLNFTYIGEVVISVNPYQTLDIYGPDAVKKYRHKAMFQVGEGAPGSRSFRSGTVLCCAPSWANSLHLGELELALTWRPALALHPG